MARDAIRPAGNLLIPLLEKFCNSNPTERPWPDLQFEPNLPGFCKSKPNRAATGFGGALQFEASRETRAFRQFEPNLRRPAKD
jgi:hypothetical protein